MSSGNFTYPPWSSLNFTHDCTLTSQFLTSWYQSLDRHVYVGPEITLLLDYFRAALPNSTSTITKGQIVDWYYATLHNSTEPLFVDPQFMTHVISDPLKICNKEFCSGLGYSGNPDIGGIGMLVGYTMEAVMAILYLIAFLSSKELRTLEDYTKYSSQKKDPNSRIVQAVRGTITNFIESSLLFTFSVLIATMLIGVGNIRGVDIYFSKYSMALAQLTSLFSGAVVLSVWPLQWQSLRRKKLRKGIGFALYALTLAAIYVQNNANNESTWDMHCFQVAGDTYWKGMAALVIIPAGIWFLTILAVFLDSFFEKLEIYRNWSSPSLPFDIPFGWIIAFYGFASTWALFGIFLDLRERIKNAAGDSYQENQWGFGQVLAVGTWAPVIIEFFYILLFGSEEALEGRVPKPWVVKWGKAQPSEQQEHLLNGQAPVPESQPIRSETV